MNSKDFLHNDLFIYWRTHPTKELDIYWGNFLKENNGVEECFYEAIAEFEEIRHTQNSFIEEEFSVKKKLYTQIENRKTKKLRWVYSSSAAAILLLLIGSIFFIKNKNLDTLKHEVSIGEVMSDTKIQLISGGHIVNIGNNAVLNLTEKKNNALIQDSLSQKEVKLQGNNLNTLIVPFGQRTSIILADGSKAYLNSGTEIKFPTTFTGKSREISVKGEIFIEVTKQSRPFVIHTPNSRINVFGTSFNVSSYADEDKESVVLVTGSVEITNNDRSLMLKPNEMAEIKHGKIDRKTVDVSEFISWKNGFIQFYKTPLNDVLKKIGRYYNVEFKYKNELNLQSMTCSGKLFLADNLNDVLKAFSEMTSLRYEQNTNQIIYIQQKN